MSVEVLGGVVAALVVSLLGCDALVASCLFFCVGVQSAVSVRWATAFRLDAVLVKVELLLLLGRFGIEVGMVAGYFRGVSMVLDHAPSPGICLSPTDG